MIGAGVGVVQTTRGDFIFARLPAARIGASVRIESARGAIAGTIAAVDRGGATIACSASLDGVAAGDRVTIDPATGRAVLGYALLGRAIDGAGRPLDGAPVPAGRSARQYLVAPPASERAAICEPFDTGVRAIDGLLTIGRGARVGIFGPAGTGKSTLLETIAGGAQADAVVIALVGERGREASAWIARRSARTTIVCATGDRPAIERLRAAEYALAQAAALRERGMHVLVILDSLARYAYALRETRLALGEAPGRGGYPPGVYTELARLLESAGTGRCGSITLLATVLSDGSEDDPLAEAARSLLDGHITLSPARAAAGAFPAIDVTASASRTMHAVTRADQRRDAGAVRHAIARIAETKDARDLGLGASADPALARALESEPAIEAFLRQDAPVQFEATAAALRRLAARLAG